MPIFFDSHGAAWTPCSPSLPGATNFGPTGAARPASAIELAAEGIEPVQGASAYATARALGRIDFETDEWERLIPRAEERAAGIAFGVGLLLLGFVAGLSDLVDAIF
jgi:hypothetical protein